MIPDDKLQFYELNKNLAQIEKLRVLINSSMERLGGLALDGKNFPQHVRDAVESDIFVGAVLWWRKCPNPQNELAWLRVSDVRDYGDHIVFYDSNNHRHVFSEEYFSVETDQFGFRIDYDKNEAYRFLGNPEKNKFLIKYPDYNDTRAVVYLSRGYDASGRRFEFEELMFCVDCEWEFPSGLVTASFDSSYILSPYANVLDAKESINVNYLFETELSKKTKGP